MKSVWKKQRQNAQISVYKVFKELQKYEPTLTEQIYRDIENNKRDMPQNLIGPFSKYVNKKRDDYKLEKTFSKIEVEQWYKDTDLKELMKEYGYSQKELADKFGTVQSHMCNILNKKGAVSIELKEKLKDFLTNPLNKKLEAEPKKRVYTRKVKEPSAKTNKVSVPIMGSDTIQELLQKVDKILELEILLSNACKVIEEKDKKISELEKVIEIYEKVIR